MQEFCPVCSKNGIKSRVRTYQLNFQEAIFMCTSEKCTWPVGHQELTVINRPVGKDWSHNWDDAAFKNQKNELDILLDFSVYTPPQTPGTEVIHKDATNNLTSFSATVPDDVSNSLSTLIEDNIYKSQEIPTNRNKQSKPYVDNSINSNINLKPKLVVSKPVSYKLEKLPAKGYMLKKNESNGELSKNVKLLTNVKSNVISNTSISLVNNPVKNDKLNHKILVLNKIKEKPRIGLKVLNRKKAKAGSYEKFDFNTLMKAKSTNVRKQTESNVVESVENIEPKPKEHFNEANERTNLCTFDKMDLDEILDSKSTNIKNECDIDLGEVDRSIVDSSSNNVNNYSLTNFASTSALTNSSKYSGLDPDTTENNDFDLDNILAGLSDTSYETTSDINNMDDYDYKWINSLFVD